MKSGKLTILILTSLLNKNSRSGNVKCRSKNCRFFVVKSNFAIFKSEIKLNRGKRRALYLAGNFVGQGLEKFKILKYVKLKNLKIQENLIFYEKCEIN